MKETTIICRLKTTEKDRLESEANEQGITLSELIRQRVMKGDVSKTGSRNLAEVLCGLMTEIRRLGEENPDISIEGLEREAGKLWEF